MTEPTMIRCQTFDCISRERQMNVIFNGWRKIDNPIPFDTRDGLWLCKECVKARKSQLDTDKLHRLEDLTRAYMQDVADLNALYRKRMEQLA